MTTVTRRSLVHWSRRPTRPLASSDWRQRIESLEACHPKALSSRGTMAQVDAQLAPWLRGHTQLIPTDIASGESSMALLLLWEVDHGQPFPTQARPSQAKVLLGFTKLLKRQIAADDELRHWLQWKEFNLPLSPGLPPSHHTRWTFVSSAR